MLPCLVVLQCLTLWLSFLVDHISVVPIAAEFLRCAPEGKYDAIIVDSSDPVGTLISLYYSSGKNIVCNVGYHKTSPILYSTA